MDVMHNEGETALKGAKGDQGMQGFCESANVMDKERDTATTSGRVTVNLLGDRGEIISPHKSPRHH